MDNITLIRSQRVTPTETHFEIKINRKIVQFAKWVDEDFSTDYEFIKGNDKLNEDELDEVIYFIDEQTL